MTSRVLSARGEQEWVRLRRHLDRSRGFWLGIVLTEDAVAADILRERARANRRGRAEHFVTLRAADPAELGGILDALESDGAPPRGCTWVTAPLLPDPEWLAAWRRAFRSLNHRRDVLRDRMGGLVIVAPGAVKVDAQREAPDLWSVRDLLVELRIERPSSGVGRVPEMERPQLTRAEGAAGLGLGAAASDDLAEQVAVLLAMSDEELSGAARLLAAAATATAIEVGDEQTAAVLLLRRALAVEEAGDLAGALDLIRSGTRLGMVDEPTAIRLNDNGARIAHILEDLPLALSFAQESLAREEARYARVPGVETGRDLAISLVDVGRIELDRRDLDSARERFTRALALREQIVAAAGTDDDRLAVAAALRWCGDVDWELGSWVTALAYLDRAVRSADEVSDDDAWALQERATAHESLGQLEHLVGDTESARSHLVQALLQRERLISDHGARPWEAALVLGLLGQVDLDAGEPAAARERLTRSLALREQRVEEAPSLGALAGLAIGLRDLGDVDRLVGDHRTARVLYSRALAIDERLAAELGTDHARRELAVALNRLGDTEVQLDDPAAAHERFTRSFAIATDLAEREPTPDAVDGLVVGLRWLAEIERTKDDLPAAHAHLLRAVDLARKLTDMSGTRRSLRLAASMTENLAEVEAELGRPTAARDRRAEAVATYEQLADWTPAPLATEHLSSALDRLATAEDEAGDQPTARRHLVRALDLDEQLARQLGTAKQWHDVRHTLRRLVERTDGPEADGYRARLVDVDALLARLDDTTDG